MIINGIDVATDTKWDKYEHDFAALREAKKKIWMESQDNEPVLEDIPDVVPDQPPVDAKTAQLMEMGFDMEQSR